MLQRPYPVTFDVERPEHYDRLKVLFRIILAVPQLILLGALVEWWKFGGEMLSGVLVTLVIFAWVWILATGVFPQTMRDFALLLFRWIVNVDAYVLLLTEPYPPFGVAPYPVNLEIIPAEQYNRLTVFFRVIIAIPHYIVLFFLGIAASVVTIIAWFAILFTGQYPQGMYNFTVGVTRWGVRVSAYVYLFVDDYPPFSLSPEPGGTPTEAQPA